MKNPTAWIIITVITLSIVGGVWLYFSDSNSLVETTALPSSQTEVEAISTDELDNSDFEFNDPKKSAHFESNTPAHESVLPGVPVSVVVDFNFDLANGSSISISREGKDYGTGPTIIDNNRLAMRRIMDPESPDGIYTVLYKACWPDRTCHDGFYQFAIDRNQVDTLTDWTNQVEATIDLSNLAFSPKYVRLSRGTTVTWYNQDSTEHYINSDSHPAHTQVLEFNSRALKPGDSFQFTFEQPGVYNYHCSAHAGAMTGMILVE